MPSTPAVSWDDLNERQRTYLLALYQCDQAEERYQRSLWAQGGHRPAEEWRWRALAQLYPDVDAPKPSASGTSS